MSDNVLTLLIIWLVVVYLIIRLILITNDENGAWDRHFKNVQKKKNNARKDS